MIKSDLTDEEKHFFSQPSSWKFGPTYDTAIVVDGSINPYEISKAALELLDLTVWEGSPESCPFKTVVRLGNGCSIGLFHLCSTPAHRATLKYVFAIYPLQFERAIGAKIEEGWQSMDSGRLMHLHGALINLIRHINSKIQVLGGTILKEDLGSLMAYDTSGLIYLESAVTERIGLETVKLNQPIDQMSAIRI